MARVDGMWMRRNGALLRMHFFMAGMAWVMIVQNRGMQGDIRTL